MTRPAWHSIVGTWSGTDRVWFEPSAPVNESPIDTVVRPTLGGRGVVVESRWTMGDEEQFTTLVLVADTERPTVRGALIGTFHTDGTVMVLSPVEPEEGITGSGALAAAAAAPPAAAPSAPGPPVADAALLVEARGSYEADGEMWGWHVVLRLPDHDHLIVEAYNVEPSGAAALGVRSDHVRVVDPHDEVAV